MKKSKIRNQSNAGSFQQTDEEQVTEEEIIPHQNSMPKSILYASFMVFAVAILAGFFTSSFSEEGAAEEVVANRISTATAAGEEVFAEEVNADIEARNFEVTKAGPDGGEARMLVWDYNSIDYDEVAVYVDGTPVKEKLILSENAAAISIPVPSKVTITGVKDNGGGISYAVKFPNNRTTYFNVVSTGNSNVYTVLPKP